MLKMPPSEGVILPSVLNMPAYEGVIPPSVVIILPSNGIMSVAVELFWLGGSPARASPPTYPQIHVSLRISATLPWKTETVDNFLKSKNKYICGLGCSAPRAPRLGALCPPPRAPPAPTPMHHVVLWNMLPPLRVIVPPYQGMTPPRMHYCALWRNNAAVGDNLPPLAECRLLFQCRPDQVPPLSQIPP